MRVAILYPNFVDYDGGARVAELQAQELGEQGNYVAIFALRASIKPKNTDVYIIGMPQSMLWERIYRLIFPLDIFRTIRWLRKLKSFDLIITHQYPMTWLAYLAKRFYKVKHTVWYHGIMDPQYFPRLYERIYIRLQIFMTRLTVKNADRAVAVSKYARSELKRYTGLDSEVIYNKIHLDKFRTGIDGSKIRSKYSLGDAPVLLFVGGLRPVKGVHLLIQAFNLLKHEIPDAKLVIVGRPDYAYYYEELKHNSDASVIFTNFIPHDDLPFYYAMCDLYVTGSLWETFNVPIVEAQACGKPVVAFDIGPHPEVINGHGILVEAGNVEKFAEACIKKLREVRGNR